MEEEILDGDGSLPEEENGETSIKAPGLTAEEIAELQKRADAYEAQKIRAEKAEKLLKTQTQQKVPVEQTDTIDQIKLGKKLVDYSDDELDFVVDYAKSKKPEDVLKALENPFVIAGIQAQREKVEKEKALRPSSTQSTTDKPKTLNEAIKDASLSEKEELLKKMGLYKEFTPRSGGFMTGR